MEMKDGIPDGQAQLFKKGVVQLSWTMVNGKRDGHLMVYEDGIASKMITWADLEKAMRTGILREVVNDKSGTRLMVEMAIERGVVVYKGGYDENTMRREGYGVEYDEESGVETVTGYYHDGNLVHMHQTFEKNKNGDLVMHEYDGDESVDNVNDLFNLMTVYIGEYRFDEQTNKYVRSGMGNEIDKFSGMCNLVIEREEEERNLFGGWYGDGKIDQSIHMSELKRVEEEERRYWNESVIACPRFNLSYPRGVEEIVIEDNSMNEDCGDAILEMKLDLSEFKRLKRIVIGNACFQCIREFVLDGLEKLESVEIGEKCFRVAERFRRDDGLLRITNCPNLRDLVIGDWSFNDFSEFKLSNVNSLQSIEFKGHCFLCADCILKDLPSIQQLSFGKESFVLCQHAQFENLPKLTTISLNGDCIFQGMYIADTITPTTLINGYPSHNNTLIMKNLPSLTSIQSGTYIGLFLFFGRVILEDIPNLNENQIHCGEMPFEFTADLSVQNADGLKRFITRHSIYNPLLKGNSNNHFYVTNDQQMTDIPKEVEHLYFINHGNEMTSLDFSSFGFTQLKSITISSNCFKHVRSFVLDGLDKLESVKIGSCSLFISNQRRDDGLLRITNCPNLRELVIGYESFADFNQFELLNVNSLQSIEFGGDSFYYAENCILKDMPSLQQVKFGENSLANCHIAQFENLPNLITISLHGEKTLRGDIRDHRKMKINGHESFDNTLVMKDLHSLVRIQYQGIEKRVHSYIGRVVLENIPNLTLDNIDYKWRTFYYTADVQATNADSLAEYIQSQPKEWKKK